MPSSNAIPGPRQAHEACDSGVWGSVLPCDIVTAKVSPFFFFFNSPFVAIEPLPELLSSCRLGGVSVMSVPLYTTMCRREREMIIYYVQVVHVMHYTYTHCGGPPSMPRVHDETGEFSTRYCIQHAHCTSSVFTCVQVCLAVEKKKCLHLGFVRLLHSVGSPFFFFLV